MKLNLPVGTRLRFRYQNWRGVDHEYLVDLESIEFGPYDAGGLKPDRDVAEHLWVLHGFCVERDGTEREDRPRRTFLMNAMEKVEAA